MRYSYIAAPLALAAGANAWGNGTVVYTTEVVTAFTTFCPSATSFTHGTSTYVVTEATTLTITNCPCTVTKPVSTSPAIAPTAAPVVSITPVASSPVATSPAEVATTAAPVIPAPASPIFSNSTGPAAPPRSPPPPPQPALLPLRVPLPQSHPSNPSRVPPTGWLRRVLASLLCSDLPLTCCKFSQFGNACRFPSAFQRVALDGLSPVWSGKSGDTQIFYITVRLFIRSGLL
ncbi:hypothetical protein ABVK25_004209 [Lepraria finkii]|uniref:Uncharacterized protein n=1 Tax=Lepraria finkii TaxID=1340010 RepID=A0ABR4BEE7_9LECA